MKKPICLAVLGLALTFVSCAKKPDVQADVQAINKLLEGWARSARIADVDWFMSTYYTPDALRLAPNRPPLEGKEAIRADTQSTVDKINYDKAELIVHDVNVSGDLAVARGASEAIATPKAGGEAIHGRGKWVAAYRRQPDGSWRCQYDIWNSDEPAPGASAGGVEESALAQLERDWADAQIRSDIDALDKIMAAGWTNNEDGQVTKKSQVLADLKSGAAKVESVVLADLRTAVYGDTATVFGLWTSKGTQGGKDASGRYRFVDIFKKREGRWESVATYSSKVQE